MRVSLCAVVLLALAGCGEPARPVGEVSGRVTLGDEPLNGGSIRFHPAGDGAPVAADIGYEGTYKLAMLPPGEYRVVVETSFLRTLARPPGAAAPPEKGKPAASPGKKAAHVLVDPVFETKAKTPLKATIKNGPQTLDFDCTPPE